jgi:hypothetical protein
LSGSDQCPAPPRTGSIGQCRILMWLDHGLTCAVHYHGMCARVCVCGIVMRGRTYSKKRLCAAVCLYRQSDFNTDHCVCLLLTVRWGYKRTRDKMRFEVLACNVAVFRDVKPWGLVDYISVLGESCCPQLQFTCLPP